MIPNQVQRTRPPSYTSEASDIQQNLQNTNESCCTKPISEENNVTQTQPVNKKGAYFEFQDTAWIPMTRETTRDVLLQQRNKAYLKKSVLITVAASLWTAFGALEIVFYVGTGYIRTGFIWLSLLGVLLILFTWMMYCKAIKQPLLAADAQVPLL